MKKPSAKSLFLNSGIAATTIFLIPSVAAAHLVTTGMGPVYDGIGHLLLTPEDLVPAMAVAIYAGLRGKNQAGFSCTCFPPGLLADPEVLHLLLNYSPDLSPVSAFVSSLGALS